MWTYRKEIIKIEEIKPFDTADVLDQRQFKPKDITEIMNNFSEDGWETFSVTDVYNHNYKRDAQHTIYVTIYNLYMKKLVE